METKQPSVPKPKLTYFELYGRAEPIRLALHYAKVDFEDIQLSREKFAELKAAGEFPLGQVPVLEYNGKKMTQSRSILRFLCQKWGYYPNDPEQVYACEALCDFRSDVQKGLIRLVFIQDPEEKKKAATNFFENDLPVFLKSLESFYKNQTGGTGYMVGKTMTMADIIWVDFYVDVLVHPDRKEMGEQVLSQFPELKKYFEMRVQDFKEYLAVRPLRPF